MNKRIRLIVNAVMTVLLPILMAYSLVGEKFHEIAGTAAFGLFIFHHVMNRKWYKSVARGKYTPRRVLQTVLNLILTVLMILQPLSGILMSKHLYTFIHIPGISASMREIHLLAAYWSFVLMCVHGGTHSTGLFGRLKKRGKSFRILTNSLCAALSCYGIYAFIKRQIPVYMFGKSVFVFFDYSEPKVFFFLDYAAIMGLFFLAGCALYKALKGGKNLK